MAAVQFYGYDETYGAIENRQCPAWGIFQGSQFLFKYEGEDMPGSLSFVGKILDCLRSSEATYSIKFFEPETPKQKIKIKQNTPYDGSFNFKMIEPEERETRRRIGYAGEQDQSIKAELIKLQQQIKEMKEQEVDDEPETVETAMIGLLKKPSELATLVNIFRGSVGLPIKNFGIGSVNTSHAGDEADGELSASDEEKATRLANALDKLESKDSKILSHLEMMAEIPQHELDMYLSILDSKKKK